MSKVVGLSGAQGGGKSTLLGGLRNVGWKVDYFKVSRAVQAQLGWDRLDTVLDNVETMQRFQEEVLAQKLKRDQELRSTASQDIVLTERTFADICAYTTYWTWELVDAQKWEFSDAVAWLHDYTGRCIAAQSRCYDAIILLPFMSHVQWAGDPNRASFSSVNTVWESIERFTQRFDLISMPSYYVKETSVDGRVDEVDNFLRTL